MNGKKSKNRIKKEEIVSEISQKAEKAKGFLFANYQGLTHKQIEELKKGLKANSAEFVIAKNTLLKKALTNIRDLEALEGPTATVFVYEDIVAPLKEIAKLIKQVNLPSFKFGVMDGQTLTGEQLIKISTLPSKEGLIAQVVGGLKSPIFGLHRALNWNLQKLALTLNAISEQRSEEVKSNG